MVIIGAGRVGRTLEALAREVDEPCTLISRTEGWDELSGPPGTPILVAVRADDLDAVIDRVPEFRRGDLVFVQNGMITPVLGRHGLRGATRGLLFFAASGGDQPPQIGDTPSPFTGPHALTVVRFLTLVGVPAKAVDWPLFAAWELEKLIWTSAFGLLCQAHQCDVGTVCDAHADDLDAVVGELRTLGRAALNVDLPQEWLVERLVAYSRTIPTYRGALKAWPWRNGWFVDPAARLGRPMPAHERLLEQAGGRPDV